jgi:hypothetical protein
MSQYAVLTDTFITGWANCLIDDDGYPLTFASRKEAEQALDEIFLNNYGLGLSSGDYKIEEVSQCQNWRNDG